MQRARRTCVRHAPDASIRLQYPGWNGVIEPQIQEIAALKLRRDTDSALAISMQNMGGCMILPLTQPLTP